jgi:hypothetical protein
MNNQAILVESLNLNLLRVHESCPTLRTCLSPCDARGPLSSFETVMPLGCAASVTPVAVGRGLMYCGVSSTVGCGAKLACVHRLASRGYPSWS